MFTPARRAELRDRLVASAHQDAQVTAAALVGSGAVGREDAWSDVDLALRLAKDASPVAVADHWTGQLYAGYDAVDHLDVWAGGALYRVFLLPDTLQVDLSFWPSDASAATGPAFRLLFGEAPPPRPISPPDPRPLVGRGWLHALHARSAIARARPLQALQMLDGLRDQVVALACLRHQLPPHQGRGVDDLPPAETERLAGTLVGDLDPDTLGPALGALVEALLTEAGLVDPALAARLAGPCRQLVEPGAQVR